MSQVACKSWKMADRQGVRRKRQYALLVGLFLSIQAPHSYAAETAKGQYAMDLKADCISTGYLDMPRGQVTYVRGQSGGILGSSQQLTCSLMFQPQTEGDTMRVSLEPGAYISDCDVALEIQLSNKKYTLGCQNQASDIPTMDAVDGKALVRLSRQTFGDRDYQFQVKIQAYQTEAVPPPSSSSSEDTGMIAGIVAGIIVLIIILIIICVCCYRKKRDNRAKGNYKKDMTNESIPTSISYGNDNIAVKNGSIPDSPGSGRRLLGKTDEAGKPRSALDRFGPTPSPRATRRIEVKQKEDDYEDRDLGRRREYEDREPGRRRDIYEDRDPGRRRDDYEERDYGRRRGDYADRDVERGNSRERSPSRRSPPRSPLLADLERNPKFRRSFHETEAENNRQTRPDLQDRSDTSRQSPPKSPVLAALHNNPKFRRSFHENEADADERVRRVSDRTNSSTSVDSTGRPVNKPKLPPVPKSPPRSPSPQRRGEKIAGIFRAQPSISSSEGTKFDDGDSDERGPARGKSDTRHTLRPNRGERKVSERKPRDERRRDRKDDDDSEDERRRERDRKDEERQRRRREKEEDAGRDRKREERRHKEDEEEEREREKRDGRFKKSASGRRSKGKGQQRMARSRSTGNALEEMDANYQRSRSKSPSSVRSLGLGDYDDDDDDLDSNYMPFRRAGSKTSLYASRSSLYGRRRKNSMGETISLSSYAHTDDVDSRMGDFDKSRMSHREKERMFRSTGDLEMRPASAIVVRECATQTGHDKGVSVYGRKTLAKGKTGKRYSRGTQTLSGRERRDSTGSARSGRSTRSGRLKSKSKSQESLRREKRSRSREFSEDDSDSDRRNRRGRSKSRDRHYSDDDLSDSRSKGSRSKHRDYDTQSDRYSSKHKPKPKARPRKSTGADSVDFSGSDDDRSVVTSSMAPSSIQPINQPLQNPVYGAQFIPPSYPVVYTQPGVPYMPTAPGGPPMMVPVAGVTKPPVPQKPKVAPKPAKASKWDELVNLTDGMKQRRRQMGESVTEAETASVFSSMWSQPVANGGQPQVYYAPPSYTTAQKMPDPNSTYSYQASESNV